MMRGLLQQNKKGVSEMVGYVLLVVIAVGLSVLVFAYLRLYIPKGNLDCQEGINLAIDSAGLDCTKNELRLTLVNQGRFTVDAAYVRFAAENRKIRTWINQEDNKFYFSNGIVPGASYQNNHTISADPGIKYIVEVQPAIFVSGKISACQNIVTQIVSC